MTRTPTPFIPKAKSGDERGIHEAHMRSIREVCSKVHNADEISGSQVRGYPMALDISQPAVELVFQNTSEVPRG